MFKTAYPFTLIDPSFTSHRDIDALEQSLQERAHHPIGAYERASVGFVPPLGGDGPLVHAANGYALFAVLFEERKVPMDALRHELDKEIRALETAEDRKVGRKETRELRDQIEQNLLPKVLPSRRQVLGYFSPKGRLIVEASSANRAGDVASLLREVLDTLPIVRWSVVPDREVGLTALMTRWLREDAARPKELEIGDEALLRGEEGETVRLSHHDLSSEETLGHLAAGKQVARLGLVYADHLSFVLDEDGPLLKVRETDVLAEEIDSDTGLDEDRLSRATSELVVKAREIDALLDLLAA